MTRLGVHQSSGGFYTPRILPPGSDAWRVNSFPGGCEAVKQPPGDSSESQHSTAIANKVKPGRIVSGVSDYHRIRGRAARQNTDPELNGQVPSGCDWCRPPKRRSRGAEPVRNPDHRAHHTMLTSLSAVQGLLNDTLRVTVTDGRIFLGTFVGTDSELNILLLNTDEFRLGPNENPNGRFVGQVMIPWRLVNKVEARLSPQSPDGMFT